MNLTYTMPNGPTVDIVVDRIIRQAEVVDGVKLATELYGISRQGALPSLRPGSLVIFTGKRLPD